MAGPNGIACQSSCSGLPGCADMFARPETLHIVLEMGQGPHLTALRGYLLTAYAA